MATPDYYKTLGVPRDADADAIRCVDSLVHLFPLLPGRWRGHFPVWPRPSWDGNTQERAGGPARGYFSAFSAASSAASRALLASMSRAMEPGMARPIFL